MLSDVVSDTSVLGYCC